MIPLLALAETAPTTLTGALVAGLSGLAGAVVWLATRLLAAKDAHSEELRRLLVQRGEDVERLTEALGGLRSHTEALEAHTEAHARRSR